MQICGVSLAWVGFDHDQWISCKELKDRRLHHVDDVEKRAHDLNLRLRHSKPDEYYLFRKMGAGARSACKARLVNCCFKKLFPIRNGFLMVQRTIKEVYSVFDILLRIEFENR